MLILFVGGISLRDFLAKVRKNLAFSVSPPLQQRRVSTNGVEAEAPLEVYDAAPQRQGYGVGAIVGAKF